MKQLCVCNGRRIFGEVFLPEGSSRAPLVVMAHEFGQNHFSAARYAQGLNALGWALCVFDFCGGTTPTMPNESDPNPDMTVLSERDELIALVRAARSFEGIDPERIVLCGASQGGLAAALAAPLLEDEITALMLIYPALCIRRDMMERFGSKEAVPERFDMWDGWMKLSGRYVTELWDVDVYSILPRFEKPVLIIHGDADALVDISFSERMSSLLGSCTFRVIHGARHGFNDEQLREAVGFMESFLVQEEA